VKAAFLRGALAASAVVAAVLLTCSTAQAATPRHLAGATEATPPRVLAVQFDSDVNPVTQDYLNDEIARANKGHYDAVAIVMDTPGGLSESMRKIVKVELASKVPVIVYVSPNGSRAASAGVWIGQAADILAMAPQTNIGSSTPINLGGTNIQSDLRRKVINDAAASLVALAASHHRNAVWASQAVRVASNLPARTALRKNVIDVVSPTLPALLNQIDGRKTIPKGIVMHTAGAEITEVKMGLWRRILNLLIDPNLISLMLSLGVLGLIVELWHPGLIFPATFGILCLAIAFYGLDVLPVNWAGLILIAAAFAFWIAELFIAFSHGALTLAGAACFVFGTLLLFQPAGSGYQVSVWVSVAVALTVSAFFALALTKVVQIRRRPPSVGPTAIVGLHGEVRTEGLVSVNGELWKARVENGEHLTRGEDIEVVALDGLELVVRRVETPAPV
jgi:membrane-bound serine protease (ClpP class)